SRCSCCARRLNDRRRWRLAWSNSSEPTATELWRRPRSCFNPPRKGTDRTIQAGILLHAIPIRMAMARLRSGLRRAALNSWADLRRDREPGKFPGGVLVLLVYLEDQLS